MTTNKPEVAMTDREMLELAAKAAGINIFDWTPGGHPTANGSWNGIWNPLAYDGDALRLAVALKIDIHQRVADPRVSAVAALQKPMIESCDDSTRLAATRRAIVRAAAETGREMT